MSSSSVQILATGAVTGSPAMFPAAVDTPDGLVVAYSTVPDGWPGGEVHVTRSDRTGETWSTPVVAAAAHAGEDAVLGALGMVRLANGALLLPVNAVTWNEGDGVAGRQIVLRLLRSDDGGATWTNDVPVAIDFAWPAVYGQILELGDELLWPVWGRQDAAERWRSALLSSTDGGLTWSLKATIGYDPDARLVGDYVESGNTDRGDADEIFDPEFRPHDPTDGFTETSVCALGDGRLFAILRQQGVGGDRTLAMFRSRSNDGGSSWSPYEPAGFSGMSPALHRLPDDSLLLATRRHVPVGSDAAPGVEVRIGPADGTSWSDVTLLEDPYGTVLTSEYQCGYPAIVPQDGGVRVFFYSYRPDEGRYIAWNQIAVETT